MVTINQFSSLFFLVPALTAFAYGIWLSVAVLCLNAGVSFAVHRHERGRSDPTDVIDLLAIALWLWHNVCFWLAVRSLAPVIMAGLVFACAWLRKQLRWRSRKRLGVHVFMHYCGAFGTLLLLHDYCDHTNLCKCLW